LCQLSCFAGSPPLAALLKGGGVGCKQEKRILETFNGKPGRNVNRWFPQRRKKKKKDLFEKDVIKAINTGTTSGEETVG